MSELLSTLIMALLFCLAAGAPTALFLLAGRYLPSSTERAFADELQAQLDAQEIDHVQRESALADMFRERGRTPPKPQPWMPDRVAAAAAAWDRMQVRGWVSLGQPIEFRLTPYIGRELTDAEMRQVAGATGVGGWYK